jgi:hypothetical protein
LRQPASCLAEFKSNTPVYNGVLVFGETDNDPSFRVYREVIFRWCAGELFFR